ncbi:DUF2191 domain-containing protein [Euzebya tangerina]|uniref:DUF2191 domain-containing protein n=1 Tax=Euzebya tangerina TaxID=591198 RepID=UPI0013C31A60|nr:DUF2191 domain-containing protein [Euzebya tangerina]
MKTTVEIPDALFAEAKLEAARRGVTFKALIEEGLVQVLRPDGAGHDFTLPDASVGGRGAREWHSLSHDERLALIYDT